LVAALALALASGAAVAFQEQTQGGAMAPTAAPSAVPSSPPITVPLNPDNIRPPAASGTEIRIPGLGRLGVLPKMDFGLDLLYGAAETRSPIDQKSDDNDGLTIRGTVKRKF
jgi:hypothetical protein